MPSMYVLADFLVNIFFIPKYKMKHYGSRVEVFHGKAKQTRYGLKKGDLMLSAKGRIVSLKKSKLAKKSSNLGTHIMKKKVRKTVS